MKINKKRILSLIICVIVLIVVLIVVIIHLLNKKENDPILQSERDEYLYYENNPAQIVNGRKPTRTRIINLYYTIEDCVKSYLTMVKSNDTEVVSSYLNEDFIKQNGINEQNIFNKIKKFDNIDLYTTVDMYELDGVNYFQYYVKGKIDKSYIYFVVDTDTTNQTFDIFPINEDIYIQDIEKVAQTDESQEKSISKKTYNFYKNRIFSDEDLCRLYYTNYIKLMLTDFEEAYNMLNDEYRNNKFGNIDNFKKYIQSFKNYYERIYKVETADSANYDTFSDYYNFINNNSIYQMKKYAVNDYEEYKQCICGNITGSNVILNVYYPGTYEVYLDSYTCDLPQFLEKYNKSSKENKVAMNLEKIKGALNTKDYKYIYSKLDDTFKKNKFGSADKLEEYLKNNFFEYNNFDYEEVKLIGNLYSAKINVTDIIEQRNASIELNAVMRIDDDTNFVMSFSME